MVAGLTEEPDSLLRIQAQLAPLLRCGASRGAADPSEPVRLEAARTLGLVALALGQPRNALLVEFLAQAAAYEASPVRAALRPFVLPGRW